MVNKNYKTNFRKTPSKLIVLILIVKLIFFASNVSFARQDVKIHYDSLGDNFYKANQFLQAIEWYKKSVGFYEEKKDSLKLASTYNRLGNSFFMLGENISAIEYYYKALKIFENKKDKVGTAITYNSIATIYATQKNYDVALDFFNKSLDLEKMNNNTQNIAAIYNNIGNIFNDKNQHKQALEYYEKALLLQTDETLQNDKAKILLNIGSQYGYLNEIIKAELHYNRAYEIAKKTSNKYLEAFILANFADLYQKQNFTERALSYARESIGIAKKISGKNLLEINYLTMTKIFAKQGIFDSLQKYNELYISIHDSIYSEYSAQKFAELNAIYNNVKKENEIIQLRLENELKNNQYKTLKQNMVLLIALFFVCVILGIVFYLYRKRKIKTDNSLVEKTLELSELEEKLATIEHNKEIIEKEDIVQERYSGSTLSEEAKISIQYEITKLLKQEKIYLDSELTINDVSKKLNTSRTYVSQVINEKIGKSFSNLINEYRVKEAVRILSKPESKLYTIETIAKKVGFNSKSSFNIAFKSITGVTPSIFIKSLKKTSTGQKEA